MLNATEKLKEG